MTISDYSTWLNGLMSRLLRFQNDIPMRWKEFAQEKLTESWIRGKGSEGVFSPYSEISYPKNHKGKREKAGLGTGSKTMIFSGGLLGSFNIKNISYENGVQKTTLNFLGNSKRSLYEAIGSGLSDQEKQQINQISEADRMKFARILEAEMEALFNE